MCAFSIRKDGYRQIPPEQNSFVKKLYLDTGIQCFEYYGCLDAGVRNDGFPFLCFRVLTTGKQGERSMNCDCGGALIDGKSSYRVSKKHFSLIIDNIPAFKCTRCDKVLYAEETVDKIQQLVNRIERDTKEIVTGKPSTNLYDY